MAPRPEAHDIAATRVLSEHDEAIRTENILQEVPKRTKAKQDMIWSNLIIQIILHMFAIWGLVSVFTSAKLATTIYGEILLYIALASPTIFSTLGFIIYEMSMMGTMAGVHRLWSHRAYKAKLPLRLLLTLFATLAAQVKKNIEISF